MKVEELDLANALREERKSAELQHLDKDFYQQVGVYLADLGQELSQVDDPFSVEAQILQDTLKSEKNSVNKLLDQRVKKIVRRALRSARSASREETLLGMTEEEGEIYRQMFSAIATGRETILTHMAHTERPLTGKKDISQEYDIVRLLDCVPMFVGVDGKNYLLAKDDVAMLPAVHARNLRNKNLASKVNFER
jgi:DNA replication factor GINS